MQDAIDVSRARKKPLAQLGEFARVFAAWIWLVPSPS
jgi:hypothetical protein